jgi:hypothetical protein
MSTEDRELDGLLTETLHQEAKHFLPPGHLADSAVRGGRRRRRRRVFATVAGCAGIVAICGVTGQALATRVGSTGQASTGGPTSSQTSTLMSPYQWAESLPAGSSTSSTMMNGTFLIAGGNTHRLDATDAGLIGPVAGGYLTLLEREKEHPFSLTSKYAIVTSEGAIVRTLPDVSEGAAQGAVISPDGQSIAYGDSVVDAQTLEQQATLPEDASRLEAWTEQGIVYSARGGNQLLWRQGSQPLALSGPVGNLFTDNGRTFVSDSGCVTVRQVQADGGVQVVRQYCGPGVAMSLSPDGTELLMSNYQVLNVATGAVQDFKGGQSTVADLLPNSAVSWESPQRLLIAVAGEASGDSTYGASGSRPNIVVRCNAETAACERAGQPLDVDVSDQLQVAQ